MRRAHEDLRLSPHQHSASRPHKNKHTTKKKHTQKQTKKKKKKKKTEKNQCVSPMFLESNNENNDCPKKNNKSTPKPNKLYKKLMKKNFFVCKSLFVWRGRRLVPSLQTSSLSVHKNSFFLKEKKNSLLFFSDDSFWIGSGLLIGTLSLHLVFSRLFLPETSIPNFFFFFLFFCLFVFFFSFFFRG